MRKLFFTFLTLMLTASSYSASVGSFPEPKAEQVLIQIPGTQIQMTLADYVKLKPSGYKDLTGKKLNLKETIVFRINQKKIKKTIRKDGTVDMNAYQQTSKEPFKWHWGGFFLGLLVPILGMVIAAFIKDDQRKNRTTSACIGTLVACIAFFLFVQSSF